jgi:SagB-type dehydrogenase family enzyme
MRNTEGEKPVTRESGRYFLTDRIRDRVDWWNPPQSRGIAPPPVQKPATADAFRLDLPGREKWQIPKMDLAEAVSGRESRRSYMPELLSLEELSFLLWCTQGVRGRVHGAAVLRNVPSAGCRHPFETYLAVQRVGSISPGIYRFLPLDNSLVLEKSCSDLAGRLTAATRGQGFAGEAAVTFIWSAIPARVEWRYAEASYKVIAIDAGHVCQNLYLACEAIGAGTCAIAAYDQGLSDALIGVDGNDEFVVYMAPVGKVKSL